MEELTEVKWITLQIGRRRIHFEERVMRLFAIRLENEEMVLMAAASPEEALGPSCLPSDRIGPAVQIA